jgi:hypothetical protein
VVDSIPYQVVHELRDLGATLQDSPYPLFDDNPSLVDLLGLTPIAEAVAAASTDPALNPVTIGINSPWGGGKSTALNLIEAALLNDASALVVRVDPWEFVDSGDPRGTLIARVLDGLHEAYDARQSSISEEDGLREKAQAALHSLKEKTLSLKRRISWSKVAQVALKSAITLTPDIVGLVDALTPSEEQQDDVRLGMREFRQEFESLVQDLPTVTRVIVLVDDLDRCLPSDVLGAFEAIKLFLSVRGVSFVIAADEQFIRESLRDALQRREGATFADRYTQKVIQLPFTLPQLTSAMAESYLTLLLTSVDNDCNPALLQKLAVGADERRSQGVRPYAFESMESNLPSREVVHRAASIVRGMAATTLSTPRQLKRFLNHFAIRARLLDATFSDVDPEVVMKLWVLEQNFFSEFRELSSLSTDDRLTKLREWEAGDSGTEVEAWAKQGTIPSDVIDQVTAYLSLAASVATDIHLGVELTLDQARLLGALISDSELVRREAQDEIATGGDYTAMMVNLVVSLLGPRREQALDSIQQLGLKRPDLVDTITANLLREDVLPAIDRLDLPWLTPFPSVIEALRELRASDERFIESINENVERHI